MDIAPYFRRSHPAPQDPAQLDAAVIDLTLASLPDFPQPEPTGAVPDARPLANSLFDGRAAAAVSGTVGHPAQVTIDPPGQQASAGSSLLQHINYDGRGAPNISVLSDMCLAAMAYADYFPGSPTALRLLVSVAIAQASPGWCGSTGPGVNTLGLGGGPAEYDMTQMFLVPIAYAFYEDLNPDTRELLITSLLAGGTIHRVNIPGSDDAHTSGQCPEDWARAGRVASDDIPETENHVLMIATARYLTNQLLYQRDRLVDHDNRRNGVPDQSRPNCMDQVLGLLRNYLRDDFAEYNAKPYTEETRRALLNLYAFAYDAEVRLGARMVLDYISAHIAVSTDDLRRLVPFRRRNEVAHNAVTQDGFMANDLLGGLGTPSAQTADSNSPVFALLAGNTRGYPTRKLTTNFGPALVQEAVCGYRLPPSIHDLFVNDSHRRYFQRLHRKPLPELGDQRNCENMEIYVGSPSYLITAGGKPAEWSTPGQVVLGIPVHFDDTTKGVAVTTSFIPTGLSAGVPIVNALDIIQLETFSSTFSGETGPLFSFGRANYGVAPDFACGYKCRFPNWLGPEPQDGLSFTEHTSLGPDRPGFYLAIHRQQDLVVLEALDCWRYKHVSFDEFKGHVSAVNGGLALSGDATGTYTTYSGNIISFRIGTSALNFSGGQILSIAYGAGTAGAGLSDPPGDTLSDAGNYTPNVSTYQFLTGTIVSTPADGKIEIHNPALGSTLTLDWSEPAHLVRISETGDVEQAGQNYEMWVDFAWTGQTVGDFFLPCKTVTDAVNMVADGGVVKIVPGATTERLALPKGKRVKLTAPFGPVKISAQ